MYILSTLSAAPITYRLLSCHINDTGIAIIGVNSQLASLLNGQTITKNGGYTLLPERPFTSWNSTHV